MAKAKDKNTLLIEEENDTLGSSVEGTSDKKRTITDTIGYHLASVGNGVVNALEGVDDALYGVGGKIAGDIVGLFNADKGEQIKQQVATDISKQSWGRNNTEVFEDAKSNKVSTAVAEGVGGMLPSVAASLATAGIAAPMLASSAGLGMVATGANIATKLPEVASLATLGVSAMGNSMESALNDGANFDQAIEYGALQGAKEVATEKLFGGLTSGLYGAGVIDPLKKMGLTGVRKLGAEVLEEGAEEGIATLLDPLIEASTYKGKDALNQYGTKDYWAGVAADFGIGALTSLVFSGTVGYGVSHINGSYAGKEADINSCLEAIDEVTNDANSRLIDGKLELNDAVTAADSVTKNYQQIEKILMKSPAEKRASLIEKFSLDSAFDKTTGRMTEEFSAQIGQESNRIKSLNNVAPEEIKADLGKINENNHNAEIVDVNTLSDKAQLNFEKTAKAIDKLNEKSQSGLQIIPVTADETFDSAQIGNRVYMNVDAFEDGSWANNFVHEYMHFAEGTDEYNALLDVLGDDVSLIETSIEDLAKKGYSEADVQTELPAMVMENALNSEEFIDKIVSTDSSLTEKIINKVKNVSESIKNINNTEYKRLKAIEKKYINAIESAGMRYIDNKILGVPDAGRISFKQNVGKNTVSAVLANSMTFGDKYGYLSGKNASTVRNMMQDALLNKETASEQLSAAKDIADFIIDKALYERMITEENEQSITEATKVVEIMEQYKHRIDLSDKNLKKSISKLPDSQKIFSNWGLRKGYEGISLYDAINEMQSKGVVFEQITTDGILDIQNVYEQNLSEARTGFKTFKKNFDKAELSSIKDNIVNEVMDSLQQAKNQETAEKEKAVIDWFNKALAELDRKHSKEIKETIKQVKREASAKKSLTSAINKIHNLNLTAFSKSGIHDAKLFVNSMRQLAEVKFRGTTTNNFTRKAIAGLNEWYNKESSFFAEGEGALMFNEEVKSMLDELSSKTRSFTDEDMIKLKKLMKITGTKTFDGLAKAYTKENLGAEFNVVDKAFIDELNKDSAFTSDEMRMLKTVIASISHMIQHNKQVIRDGEFIDAQPLVDDYIGIIHENQELKRIRWLDGAKETYSQHFSRPETVMRYFDGYQNGFLTQTFKEFQNAEVNAKIKFMDLVKGINEVVDSKYIRTLRKDTVVINGAEVMRSSLLYNYMSLNRKQAQLGLALNGFVCEDKNGKLVRPDGFANMNDVATEQKNKKGQTIKNKKGEIVYKVDAKKLNEACQRERAKLEPLLTETDKKLIALAETMFNKSKDLKTDTDLLLRGWSNAGEDYYIPIRRYRTGQDIDEGFNFMQEMDHVSNASFNKDTVKGAQGEIFFGDFYDMLVKHARGIAMYSELAVPIYNYNLLRKIRINDRANKPITISTEMANTWKNADSYIDHLVEDIQGIGRNNRTKIGKIDWFDFVRGNWAVSTLGMNPKVLATQFSSMFASTIIISDADLAKGFSIKGKLSDVNQYCRLAEFRDYDESAAKAEVILDKLNKVQTIETAAIGKFDRLVVGAVWGGCQANIARTKNLAIGTEENKVEAGKLLERIILETQQNSFATTRSDAMRSGRDAMKVLTMFSADNMQCIGCLFDAIGEHNALIERKKFAEKQRKGSGAIYDDKIAKARKLITKRLNALVQVNAYMTGVAMLFAAFKGQLKDKDNKDALLEAVLDFFGNFLGGMPLFKDVWNTVTTGYGNNANPELSALSDVLDSVMGMLNAIQSGNATPYKLKKLIDALGAVTGISTRNIYTYTTSFMKLLPNMDLRIESYMLGKTSYGSVLSQAIEDNDDDRIATIIDIMTSGRVGAVSDKKSVEELNRLTKAGFDVLPKGTPTSIKTDDGDTVKLTKAEQKAFKATMNKANDAISKLVKSANYANASDTVKAKAIKMIYDYYYQMAKDELTGTETTDKLQLLAKSIPIEQLAVIMAECKNFTADTKNGKTVAGSKKAKVQKYVSKLSLTAAQKYMIIGCLGYSNTKGKTMVIKEIDSLYLTEDQKQSFLKSCGY